MNEIEKVIRERLLGYHELYIIGRGAREDGIKCAARAMACAYRKELERCISHGFLDPIFKDYDILWNEMFL